MSKDEFSIVQIQDSLLPDLRGMIEDARAQVAQVANAALTTLYWKIELLELNQSGIHVAEYLTTLPPRELLQQKLHTAIATSRARLDAIGEGETSGNE